MGKSGTNTVTNNESPEKLAALSSVNVRMLLRYTQVTAAQAARWYDESPAKLAALSSDGRVLMCLERASTEQVEALYNISPMQLTDFARRAIEGDEHPDTLQREIKHYLIQYHLKDIKKGVRKLEQSWRSYVSEPAKTLQELSLRQLMVPGSAESFKEEICRNSRLSSVYEATQDRILDRDKTPYSRIFSAKGRQAFLAFDRGWQEELQREHQEKFAPALQDKGV